MTKNKPKPAALPPGTVLHDYQILRKIASGGFGIVYHAVDKNGGPVAIKEYLPASLSERSEGETNPRILPDKMRLYRMGLKSFFEEGRTLAQINHPSVVSVLNFFLENDTVYMVMNYLEGLTLQDFIVTAKKMRKNRGILSEASIISLFDEVLHGLRVVHQHKMLHLDIKPANIFITDSDKAVLIDFGAAREVIADEEKFIRPMYTPGFAAPEMYRKDGNLGPWTDLYAIGSCIFSCLLGLPPDEATKRAEKDRAPMMLTKLKGVYSDHLLELVNWAMLLDPLSRPQSVFSFQRELVSAGMK